MGSGAEPRPKRILVHFELEKNESGDDESDIFIFIAHMQSHIYKVSCTRYAVKIQLRLASSETHHPPIGCTPLEACNVNLQSVQCSFGGARFLGPSGYASSGGMGAS